VELCWQVINSTHWCSWDKFFQNAIDRTYSYYWGKRPTHFIIVELGITNGHAMVNKMPWDSASVADVSRWRCLAFPWAMLNEMAWNAARAADVAWWRCLPFQWSMTFIHQIEHVKKCLETHYNT
jgi:hypothetical protein